jgi:hypothetical protein
MPKLRIITAKGWAKAARPLVFVLGIATLLAFATAADALADPPPAPILRGTDPISPGASPTPRVQGEIEGVEAKAVHFGLGVRAVGPISRDLVEPNNTVKLYTQAGCVGPVAGEGSAEDLVEGEGIQVSAPLPADSVTVFYATQSNAEGPSGCSSQGVVYRQVTTPPSAPILESVNPASPANENFPRLIGSADPEASVSIYATSDCSGAVLGSGSGATFGSVGIQVLVPDNSETTFHARVTMAGFSTDCSTSSIGYQEVTPVTEPGPGGGGGGGEGTGSGGGGTKAPSPSGSPPPPHLRTVPGGWANDNTPLVTGTAPGAATVRIYAAPDCSGSPVAKGSADEFASGLPVQVVDNVVAVFSGVSAAGGKSSGCSDSVVYVEDSMTPHTRITMGPAAKTAKRKAVFRFTDTTGNAPGTAFLCRVDGRKWKQCSSPLRLRSLRPRRYRIQVKAIDPAGNAERQGAKRSFRVVARR